MVFWLVFVLVCCFMVFCLIVLVGVWCCWLVLFCICLVVWFVCWLIVWGNWFC